MANTFYEWDIETLDEWGDVIDHDHSDKFPGIPTGEGQSLTLVKTVYKPHSSELDDRCWATVVDGKLPATFDNGEDIPQRFHKEIL